MTDRLRGRACLVTGSMGIGEAVAIALVDEGASVFVVSRTADHARSLAIRLAARVQAGARTGWAAADLRDDGAADEAVNAMIAAFGRIDGLFSVAGGSGRAFGDGPVDALTGDAFDRTIALNLRSQVLVASAVARRMLAQPPAGDGRRGSIVLVSSVLATHPVADLFATHAYAAAKGGVLALATAMAAEYAPAGIRVNVVAPGLTATAMAARAAADPASADFAARKQPLAGGLLDPADVAPTALFLLSDEARAITGQVIAVDGGWSVTSAGAEGGPGR
ncbi:MAG TPA: SDR family oxidoreductase [Candidatus Limnocylindrales bacterium]|nr:SDR family oxidoreductase [Candidatus Limnocylindrales bacterium]